MLSKLILKSYKIAIEIVLWASLFAAVFAGYEQRGVPGVVFGFIAWLIVSIVLFGLFVSIIEIRDNVRKIERHITHHHSNEDR